jgi:2-hydroxymuconate-semialdehyde hydrolase/2-hydroxy-6-oxo-octa-2,4-dienoate hydrolase
MAGSYLVRWVNAGGIKTRYLTSGEGDPVLLIHGGGAGVSAIHNWQNSMGPLAEAGFSVYAPEVVGLGLTDKPPDGNGIDAKVKHVRNFIDTLCLERVCVVGNSMGGRIALGIACDSPDRVKRMVLMGSTGLPLKPSPELGLLRGYKPSREKMREMVKAFCFDPSIVTEEVVEARYQMSLLPGAQEAYEGFMSRSSEMAMEEKLPSIKTPALLIWGRQDKIVPLELGEKMVRLLPNARLEVIDRCGHWVQVEQSDTFNRLVIGFLKGKGGEGSV